MLIVMTAMLISNDLKDGDVEESVLPALKRGDRDGWQMRMFKRVIIIVIIVIAIITAITITVFVTVLTIIPIILTIIIIVIIVIIIIIVAILLLLGGRPLADANVQAEVCSPRCAGGQTC